MTILAGNRNSGKTTELIKMCYKDNGTFVCVKMNDKKFIQTKSKKMNMPLSKVITIQELMNKKYQFNHNESFYFDNVEYILMSLLGNINTEVMSITI